MSFLNRILDFFRSLFAELNETPQPVTTAVVGQTKVTKTNLKKLTKAELADKGSELGVSVNLRDKKDTIINQVYKAQ